MNHFLLAFMAVGFLDMSISCIYIAEPISPLCMVGIMMFFIASLFLTFWSANEKADVTRKERVPWEVGKKNRPEIQKQGSWYSGIMFLEAGGASCCFLIMLIQMFVEDTDFPIVIFLFFAVFLAGAATVCIIQGIRKIR